MRVVLIAAIAAVGVLLGIAQPQLAEAQTCDEYAVMRGDGQADYYWCLGKAWHHVVPTFDPNSADGYGPTQLVPPLCVRFPDQYDCAGVRFQPPGY